MLVIVFERPIALSRDPKDPKFLLAASPPHQRVSMLQVQLGGRWTHSALICSSHHLSFFPSEAFDLLSLAFERNVVSLKRCCVAADLKVLLNQEVQKRRESTFHSFLFLLR